jgi:hypothetical protein
VSQTKLLKSVAASYDENNLRTAREVLADPDAWGGEGSGMVDWARRVLNRLASQSNNPVCVRHPSRR